MASNEVRFTVRLNVDGQTKVVDATASVEELEEAIGEVRKAADSIGLSKGWETMMLGVNAAMDVLGKLKGTVDDLASSYESWDTAMAAVNTMAGKDAAGLAQLTDQVGELSKSIPKAREELAEGNGLGNTQNEPRISISTQRHRDTEFLFFSVSLYLCVTCWLN